MSMMHAAPPAFANPLHMILPPANMASNDAAIERRITWSVSQSGFWTASIGLDHAGSIELTTAGFEVHAWNGDLEDVFDNLDDAQLSLEPEFRARARAAADARHALHNVVAASAIVIGSAAAALAVAGWAIVVPW